MRIDRKSAWIAVGVHAAVLVGALLFPLYRRAADLLSRLFTSCMLHDRLHLYCPLCGGTRALESLFSLDLGAAFAYNAFAVLFLLFLVFWDLLALTRLMRGKRAVYVLPTWVWLTVIGLALCFGILRNLLLVFGGCDPLGDLLGFWHKL